MKYVLIEDHAGLKKGQTVYKSRKYDYGIARDDTVGTGVEHISVTLDTTGDYPFQTIPVYKLRIESD